MAQAKAKRDRQTTDKVIPTWRQNNSLEDKKLNHSEIQRLFEDLSVNSMTFHVCCPFSIAFQNPHHDLYEA